MTKKRVVSRLHPASKINKCQRDYWSRDNEMKPYYIKSDFISADLRLDRVQIAFFIKTLSEWASIH